MKGGFKPDGDEDEWDDEEMLGQGLQLPFVLPTGDVSSLPESFEAEPEADPQFDYPFLPPKWMENEHSEPLPAAEDGKQNN